MSYPFTHEQEHSNLPPEQMTAHSGTWTFMNRNYPQRSELDRIADALERIAAVLGKPERDARRRH